MNKAEQDRRLIQFLLGLNEVYTVIRRGILMMNLSPTMAQAFSILIQEKKQMEVKLNNHLNLASTSLSASVASSNANVAGSSFKTNYSQHQST
ncbi:hypothetical protein RND71_001396 [Anisodus tanguticus]|uniref:Uncharacterized protein n=1 Tax=Anisodus tanguticus TaxID=243964 RepID=A0AAE1T0T6_9SOLA|nr:hypothetical protein RND71_001396 [Anisodus tanguticus]